jgi:hypothetical protein
MPMKTSLNHVVRLALGQSGFQGQPTNEPAISPGELGPTLRIIGIANAVEERALSGDGVSAAHERSLNKL